jgi:hypothetical protein
MRQKRIGLDGALRVDGLDSSFNSELRSPAACGFDTGAFNYCRRSALLTLLPRGCQ